MFIPPSVYELLKRGMDRWRPGWRERAAKRKSPWNFAEFVLGFALTPVFWYYLFQVAWLLHLYFYPGHVGHKGEFWASGISTPAFVMSLLMTRPLFCPAMVAAFLLSTIVIGFIRPARCVMDREASGDSELTFR